MASLVVASGWSSTHFWHALLASVSEYVSLIQFRFTTTLPAIALAWSALSRRPLVKATAECAFLSA
jgi:hypothetical protein